MSLQSYISLTIEDTDRSYLRSFPMLFSSFLLSCKCGHYVAISGHAMPAEKPISLPQHVIHLRAAQRRARSNDASRATLENKLKKESLSFSSIAH